MPQSTIILDEETNRKVLDYSIEKGIPKYEALVELIKLALKIKK